MGTGSFPGVKRPGRGVDHPPQSSAEVKERVELYLYSPSLSSWPVLGGTLHLPLVTKIINQELFILYDFLNLLLNVRIDTDINNSTRL